MMIIGVDYHPSFQQIAFMDQATGECGDRRLNHSDGEAEKFYRELQQPGVSVRVIIGDNLRHCSVLRDLPRHARPLPPVLALRLPKLAPFLAPDQHRENLIRVWLVEV